MSLRKTLGLSLALLVMSTAAFAKTVQVAHPAKPHSIKAPGSKSRSGKARGSKIRSATEARAHLFSPKVFGAKAFTLGIVRVSAGADAPIVARPGRSAAHPAASHPAASHLAASHPTGSGRIRPERARPQARKSAKGDERARRVARAERRVPERRISERRTSERRERRVALEHRRPSGHPAGRPLVRDALFIDRDAAGSIVHEANYSPVQPVDRLLADGPREVGTAAWYGGDRLGRRTASGAPLDMTHPTAAHRTLPLNSLARVTNLRNGRSVVVTVNDRGPVSHGFIIDLSPKAAEDLDMMRAGVAPVSVEPVIEQSASLR